MSYNFLYKLFYKIFNKNKYQNIKNKNRAAERIKYYNSHIYNKIVEIQKRIENNKELSFLHSGHLGDIMYSLPVIKELSKNHTCNLYIQINKPMGPESLNHPYGSFLLSKKPVDLVMPLLNSQTYLNSINFYNNEKIDINLDLFRDIPISLGFQEMRWFAHICGTYNTSMENSYLSVEPHNSIKNKIIIVRTQRYRNDYINYKFLKKNKNLLCLGLKSEFNELKNEIENLEFYECKDFLEMAQIIKASKFYVGNMCFPYSVAEALKVPRLLEASPEFPCVFPSGPNAFDFFHQNHFEKLFNNFNN